MSQHDENKIHELNNQIPRHKKIFTSLVAGALAGAVAKTCIAPLDRTKINFQISPDKRYSLKGAIKFIIKSYKNDGISSLWRGNTATMVRIIPHAAIQYSSYEQWKHLLNSKNERFLPPGKRYICGSLAGVTAVTCTYPLDVARARMAVTKRCMYNTIFEVFVKIYQTEGLSVFYKGYSSTVVGVIPYAGMSFFTYETLKKEYIEYTGVSKISSIHKLCFGALAGLLGQSSSYPFDIVRRRMQTAGITDTSHIYTSIIKSFYYIASTEGIRQGLFKGLSMNWIKGPIAVGISFSTFEFVLYEMRKFVYFSDES